MDLADWLKKLDLQRYEKLFSDHAIDGDVIRDLNDGHLLELGIPLGHRLKLLKAIEALRAGSAPARHAPDAAGAILAAGERRQVTVVFVDLAGYSRLANAEDPEEVHALLGGFFQQVDNAIQSHGGHIDKHIGDCVMALFGAPIAHENDCERAVRAALAARDVVKTILANDGKPLEVHIGIACGQVVASDTGSQAHREYTVTGDVVNLAARLADAAAPGEILVSQAVWSALPGRLEGVAADGMTVKGFALPVGAWQLHGMRDVRRSGRPFVGRQMQLAQLKAALLRCRETGTGQTFYLRGEAGIGKTRLVEMLEEIASDTNMACHKGLVLDFGAGVGRDAVGELVRGLLGFEGAGPAAALRISAEEAVAEGLAWPRDLVFLNDLLDLPQPPELLAFYDAMEPEARHIGRQKLVVDLLQRASRDRPRLLIVEDLHWADGGVLAHLAKLAKAVAACPAVLVLTSRLDGDPLDQAWRAELSGAPLTTIDLAPLEADDARRLAAPMLAVQEEIALRCIDRAGGNPLFLEQLLGHAESQAGIRVPGTVQSLVQARVDRLRPADKGALQAASILGQRFERPVLEFLLKGGLDDLSALIARGFIRPDFDGFLFAHALIKDAVYDTLLKRERRRLHLKAAQWFASRDVALQAQHLALAESPEAPMAFYEAARLQAAAYRYEAAERLAERGLALAGRQVERFALLCLAAELRHDVGRMAEAGSFYQAALEAAVGSSQTCRALIGLAAVKRVTDDIDGALNDLDRAEQAATAAGGQGLVEERSRIHFLRGNLLFPRSDLEGCMHEHAMSLALARQCASAELEAAALGGLGDAAYLCGRLISAHDHFSRCIALARDHGFGRIEVANRPMAALTRWYAGETAKALADARDAIMAAERVGHRRAEMVGHHAAYLCCFYMTQFADAMHHAERALVLAQQLSAPRFEAEALAFRAEILRELGQSQGALNDAQAALALGRQTGMTYIGPILLGVLARIDSAPTARASALEESEGLLRAGSVSHNHLLFRAAAIELCLETGAWQAADCHARALLAYMQPEPTPWANFVAARGSALASFGEGRGDALLRQEIERLTALALELHLDLMHPALARALASLTG